MKSETVKEQLEFTLPKQKPKYLKGIEKLKFPASPLMDSSDLNFTSKRNTVRDNLLKQY
jgi:hypothetical protein